MNITRRHRLRKIELIGADSQCYRSFNADMKLLNFSIKPKKEVSSIVKISREYEKIIRHWISSSQVEILPRIISFEVLIRKEFKRRYIEQDVVFQHDDTLWIVEIKCGSNSARKATGYRQLKRNELILGKKYSKVKSLLIYVDLNAEYIDYEYPEFNPDFLTLDYNENSVNGFNFYELRFSPLALFNYGLEKNVVTQFEKASEFLDEAKQLHEKREERRILYEQGLKYDQLPERLKDEVRPTNKGNFILEDKDKEPNYLLGDLLKNIKIE